MVNYLARIDRLEMTWQAYRDAWKAWVTAVDTGDTARLPQLAADLARWLDEVGIPRAAALRAQLAIRPLARQAQTTGA